MARSRGADHGVAANHGARHAWRPLPLEEIQQLAAVSGLVKTDYVEPVDDKSSSPTPSPAWWPAWIRTPFRQEVVWEFREGTTGKFVGVGIEITQEDGLVKVVSPIEGSPAFRAGLKTNDLITKIDDTAVKG